MVGLILLMAAPLPFARPAEPAAVPGAAHVLTWPGGTEWDAAFFPGGEYRCRRRDCPGVGYAGRWRLDGPRVLVEEFCADGSPLARWSYCPLAGGTLNGLPADVRLRRVK